MDYQTHRQTDASDIIVRAEVQYLGSRALIDKNVIKIPPWNLLNYYLG